MSKELNNSKLSADNLSLIAINELISHDDLDEILQCTYNWLAKEIKHDAHTKHWRTRRVEQYCSEYFNIISYHPEKHKLSEGTIIDILKYTLKDYGINVEYLPHTSDDYDFSQWQRVPGTPSRIIFSWD